jgi:HEAT repeat protein
MLPRCVVLLPLVALPGWSSTAIGADSETAADEEALRAAHIPTDGPGLLTFFRERTLSEDERSRVEALIAQLGSDSFARRQEASAELVSFGSRAVALLRRAARHPDLEVRWRVRQALLDIERDSDPAVLAAAVRLLGRRKLAETVAVLLAYLPYAEDDSITEEVGQALAGAAVRDGAADPVLVRALTDKIGLKRGAAAAALCQAGCPEQRPAVRRLLRDPDPLVRRSVALALAEAREKAAVPVLIALLTEVPPAEAERVEEVLVLLAGADAPRGDLTDEEAGRRQYRTAWENWWTKHGAALDLAKAEGLARLLGYTLIVHLNPRGDGCVQEIDRRGNVRWKMTGLEYPIDAQVIDPRRVLVAEYSARRVTERNHRGEILWQKRLDNFPGMARRLPNGNTFIATRSSVFEIDRSGAEVWTLDQPFGRVAAVCPLPDGSVGVISITGEFQHLDRSGKVLKSFRIGRAVRSSIGTHIQVLPNGHVLVPFYRGNCVVEFDGDGKQVWTAQANRPMCVQRLPNGHTLISSRLSDLIVEVDRKGQEVWNHRCDGQAMRVHRR